MIFLRIQSPCVRRHTDHQPFFWSKLGNANSSKSFWASLDEDSDIDLVFDDLQEVFSAAAPVKAAKKPAAKAASTTISVLDISMPCLAGSC